MIYLRYRPEIERPDPQEQETIDGIIRGMTQQSETVEKREHHAVRASHAKSSALVTGRLEVAAGETLSDRVSTHHGMSIKVYEVGGEKLGGHDADTQDFVLASGPIVPSGMAKGFLRDGTVIFGSMRTA